MPAGSDAHADAAYARAQESMREVLGAGLLCRAGGPAYGVYRLTWRGRSQTGLVGLADRADYEAGRVARHELTRPDKENDRTRHIVELRAQTGPVFLAFRDWGRIGPELAAVASSSPPDISVDTLDGVLHEAWVVTERARVDRLGMVARGLHRLYICDGHHRAAAGARAARSFGTVPAAQGLLAVAFPHEALRILPYHRLVLDLNSMGAGELRAAIEAATVPAAAPSAPPDAEVPGEVCIFLDGEWFRRALPPAELRTGDPAARLEASVLQRVVLGPVLGIEDPRTSPRIRFVGGIKGPGELERAVRAGEAAIGFAMPAVSMEHLLAVADAGQLMPPKTTWFEPKLRDGVFVHAW